MRFGQDHPRWRISALSAAVICWAVQASRSRPDRVSASQMCPMCPRVRPPQSPLRPYSLPASSSASFCTCRARGAKRRARCAGRFEEEIRDCGARLRVLGEFLPTGVTRLSLRDGGRSQTAGLSTGSLRLTRCQTEGRRRSIGAWADPVPRRISTANPASASSRRTVVTVRAEQPAAAATAALVTAQCRPLP